MTERARSSLVEEMIKLIQPDPGAEARCREKIGECIIRIKKINKERPVDLPVAAVKAESKQLHTALMKVRLLVSQLSFLARTSLFYDGPRDYPEWFDYEDCVKFDRQYCGLNSAEFARDVNSLIERTGELAKGLQPPKAAPRQRPSKTSASEDAYRLIEEFSPFPPTLTKGGPFFLVASKLFEAATGEHESDLTRYCRDYANKIRECVTWLCKLNLAGLPAAAKAEVEALIASHKRRRTKRTDG